MPITPERLHTIRNFDTLLEFLSEQLDWPLPDDAALEDSSFEWDVDDLKLVEGSANRLRGGVYANCARCIARSLGASSSLNSRMSVPTAPLSGKSCAGSCRIAAATLPSRRRSTKIFSLSAPLMVISRSPLRISAERKRARLALPHLGGRQAPVPSAPSCSSIYLRLGGRRIPLTARAG